MPSPGQSTIATALGSTTFDVEALDANGETYTVAQQFNTDSEFVQQLATAMHTGWTSVSPSTVTTMVATFEPTFNHLLGQGKSVMLAIAQGIDAEVTLWAASWNSTRAEHEYAPDAASIYNQIQNSLPITSAGINAISQAAADAFMSGFEPTQG